MARLLTPRVLRRGLEIFLLGSLVGFGALLFYSHNLGAFFAAIPHLRWPWLLVGLGLASLDWSVTELTEALCGIERIDRGVKSGAGTGPELLETFLLERAFPRP